MILCCLFGFYHLYPMLNFIPLADVLVKNDGIIDKLINPFCLTLIPRPIPASAKKFEPTIDAGV